MTVDRSARSSSSPIRALVGVVTLLLGLSSNLVVPGLGLLVLGVLFRPRARSSRPYVVGTVVVGVVSGVVLTAMIADLVWGPSVGSSFG
ncbi:MULTISPECIES: hypothetical protein [unclassified Curtobacterium]|uniref:hypothetical protein n=1 Tax=unclassified Curtobacterium TaxID=257496 RepID=UPI0038113A61